MDRLGTEKKKSGRKAWYFVLSVMGLILVFSGAWFWAAQKLDESARGISSDLQASGIVAQCENQSVQGYPFRLGIFCDDLVYADPVNGITIKSGAARTAAQLYRPGHLVGEIDSPVDISLPGLAPLTLDWRNLKASSRINTGGLQQVSLVSDQFDISANDAGFRSLLASISEVQLHARPGEEAGSLELALSAMDWQINDGGTGTIESIRFKISGVIDRLFDALQQQQDFIRLVRENGASGVLDILEMETVSGGLVRISGPIEISQSGKISGNLSLDLTDPDRLIDYVESVFPPAGDALADINTYLKAFAKANDGKLVIKDFKLTIEDGNVYAGFFKVGEIPGIFQN